jgi:tetraprenyl-beta-curcumene synthase
MAERPGLAGVFTATVARHLLLVAPSFRAELAGWRGMAGEIPDPNLRALAALALRKRGNIEGASLFATLAPAAHRARTVRALVAFQAAYNYLDALSEQPSDDPVANGGQLHMALLTALEPATTHADYYRYNPHHDDGGYLAAMLDACREALAGLPSFAVIVPVARVAAARIVDFQALNLAERYGGHEALRRWAGKLDGERGGLAWWETAAGAGSSLAVHALIAAAACADLDSAEAERIDHAYFLAIGPLHTLLDSLVDVREDHESGQPSLLDQYVCPGDAAARLGALARCARAASATLARPHAHRTIVTAMCSLYLSAPECASAEARALARDIAHSFGLPLRVAIAMFRCKRLLHAVSDGPYG